MESLEKRIGNFGIGREIAIGALGLIGSAIGGLLVRKAYEEANKHYKKLQGDFDEVYCRDRFDVKQTIHYHGEETSFDYSYQPAEAHETLKVIKKFQGEEHEVTFIGKRGEMESVNCNSEEVVGRKLRNYNKLFEHYFAQFNLGQYHNKWQKRGFK